MLPLKYLGGMQIELTLANADEALHPFSSSREYSIEQAQMRMSTVSLDSALQNSFNAALLSGKALQFYIKTIHLQQQNLPASSTECQVSMVRALSRLAGLFVSFTGPATYLGADGTIQNTDLSHTHLHKSFLNPSAVIPGNIEGTADESLISWQVQIGAKNYPEAGPASNLAETFSLLRQTIDTIGESVRTISIDESGYRNLSFVVGVPLQTMAVPFSSVNTRSGDLLTVKFSNMDPGARSASRIFVHMVAETIIEVRESGVQVLD